MLPWPVAPSSLPETVPVSSEPPAAGRPVGTAIAVVAGSVVAAGFRSVRTPPAGLVDGVAVTPGSAPT